jgi:hypothetical protein
MDTDKTLRRALTEETRTQKGDTKTCLLSGLSYFFRPIRCREHLGLTDSSKQVQQCKPYPEHLERSSQVVKELKERDSHVKQEGIVRTKEEVDMQWARAAVSAGLPTSFFDNKEVRKVVHMTVECGENYIRTKPGGSKEITLPHHTFFTTKLIPKLDKFIDDKNMGKIREMTEELTTAVFSDGWTAVDHHPIVNIIMGVRSLTSLRASIDTMGEEKTMDFITALIVEHIKQV